jgi:hypothetical protein
MPLHLHDKDDNACHHIEYFNDYHLVVRDLYLLLHNHIE